MKKSELRKIIRQVIGEQLTPRRAQYSMDKQRTATVRRTKGAAGGSNKV